MPCGACRPIWLRGGRKKDLCRFLLNFNWMQAKLDATDINALMADYDLPCGQTETRLVRECVRLSAHVLAEDPEQLLGRLLDRGELEIQQLVKQAKKWGRRLWLRPLTGSLTRLGGRLLQTLRGHTSYVNAFEVSRDGRRVISGSGDGTLRIWDVETGAQLEVLRGHTREIVAVAVSAGGQWGVSGSWDHTLSLWDLERGKAVKTLTGHNGVVNAVAMFPVGRRAISASSDATLRVWDLVKGCEVLKLRNGKSRISAVTLFAEGRCAISGGDDGAVRLWDLERGRHMRVLGRHKAKTRFDPAHTMVTTVAVSADGRRAITGANSGELKLWDLENSKELGVLGTDALGFYAVAISPDGRYAVSGTFGGDVTLWDLEKRQKLGGHLTGHSKKVCAVSFFPDGRRAISASEDHTLKVWDVNTILSQHPDAVAEQGGTTRQITAVGVFPDGCHAVSIPQIGKLKVWRLSDCKCVRAFPSPIGAKTFATLPDGYRIIVGGIGLNMWDLDEVDIVQRFRAEEFDPGRVIAVSVSADGRELLSISSTGRFRSWDIETGEQKRSLKFAPSETWRIFSDGYRAISAGTDGHFKVWDIDNGTEVLSFDGHYPLNIKALVLFPEETRSLSAGWDGSLRLWDLERGVEISVIELASPLTALASAPNGRWFASAAEDGKLALWDAERMEVIASFTGDTPLTTCTFSPDSCMIIVGELSGQVHILQLEALDA